MSEDLDYIEEENGSNSRLFLILAGAMAVVAVLGVICGAALLSQRGNGDEAAIAAVTATVAAIETANSDIATQNAHVTETIVARATQDAITPTATPTNTPEPTATATATIPPPTNTPVVGNGEDGDGTGDDGTGEVGGGAGEDDAGGDSAASPTATVSVLTTPFGGDSGSGSGGLSTPTPIAGGNDTTTLPQTGINLWGGILAAFVLLFVLFAARRLRMSGS